MKHFICIAVLLFALPVFADELKDLEAKRNQINFALIKNMGAAEINDIFVLEAARRSAALKDAGLNLRQQLEQVGQAIQKLSVEKPVE